MLISYNFCIVTRQNTTFAFPLSLLNVSPLMTFCEVRCFASLLCFVETFK